MARHHFERLPVEAARFLGPDSPVSSYAGSTLIFDPGPLAKPDGGIDFPAIRDAIGSCLHRMPHFRQRLRYTPFERAPILVDDHDFNLDYHVRHTSLPRPGDRDQLRRLAARIKSGRLDLKRPLWECWVLEGLSDGRFALIFKTHYALVEAARGHPIEVLLEADAAPEREPERVPPFRPRPVPSEVELGLDDLARLFRAPRRWASRRADAPRDAEGLRDELVRRVDRTARLLGYSLRSIDTPLNGRVGPHRRFDMLSLPLADAERVRERLGGTLHDVVLTTVAGAVAGFFRSRYLNPATIDFRALMPARLEGEGERFGEWVIDLPISEGDPIERHRLIAEQTRSLGEGAPLSVRRARTRLLVLASRASASRTPANLAVLSVIGPQQPLHLRGARLVESYGHAPLRENAAAGIAAFAYDGRLCIGVNGDFDLLPDLDVLTRAVRHAFDELVAAARRPDLSLVSA